MIGAGSDAGALLVDGLGDGLLLEAPDKDFDFVRNTSFNLLQGCRMRNTKTVCTSTTDKTKVELEKEIVSIFIDMPNMSLQEYVSCPSCGRTLFDLQEISAEIREKTSHLPGVSVIIESFPLQNMLLALNCNCVLCFVNCISTMRNSFAL